MYAAYETYNPFVWKNFSTLHFTGLSAIVLNCVYVFSTSKEWDRAIKKQKEEEARQTVIGPGVFFSRSEYDRL